MKSDNTFLSILGALGGFLLYFSIFWLVMLIQEIRENGIKIYYDKSNSKYEIEIEEYKIKLKNIENDYRNKLDRFNKVELPDYELKLREYYDYLEVKDSYSFILAVRKLRLKSILKENEFPKLWMEQKSLSKGVSEQFFYEFLNESFPGKIITNCYLHNNNSSLQYLPDFILNIPEVNLFIDIEIDEPYVGQTGEPIHYEGSDDRRDNYFQSKNWLVVRFAEIQIIKHTKDCVNILNYICEQLSKAETIDLSNIKLKPIPSWTQKEANRLAFEKYRESYLPPNMAINVSKERQIILTKFS